MIELTNKLDYIEILQNQKNPDGLLCSDLLHESSPFQDLLRTSLHTIEQDVWQWETAPIRQSLFFPENLKHKCMAGFFVRSKSEVIIANMLYINNIATRYEEAVEIGSCFLYPDFTIRHPRTGDFYYWEHFGLMDDEGYRNKAYDKLKIYGNHNILPEINLILTFETSTNPINSAHIQQIIDDYFL
ncbi:MAG: hypothetical protein ACK5ML_03145 [Lachnospiraceae bacterium]